MIFWLTVTTSITNYSGSSDTAFNTVGYLNDLSFETILPGGFSIARFYVHLAAKEVAKWYKTYLGYHARITDFYGRTVFEGLIQTMEMSGLRLDIELVGIYSKFNRRVMGLLYPVGGTATVSSIVLDAVQLVLPQQVTSGYLDILQTTTNIVPQEFLGETKTNEAIEKVLSYGDDQTPPNPLHFTIYNNQVPHMFRQPNTSSIYVDWYASIKNIPGGNSPSFSLSYSDVYNKIQVLYDDSMIGTTFTSWYEDNLSKKKYDTREGTINIGGATAALAGLVGEIAIEEYKNPTHKSSLTLTGYVSNLYDIKYPLYLVRAGDTLRLTDLENYLDSSIDYPYGMSTVFITRTSYSAASDNITIEFGSRNMYMDILLTRLGISSGSIS